MKILIVEDEPLLAMNLEIIIEEAGHEVVGVAADKHAALTLAHLADAAFVDCHLRDGYTGPQVGQALANEFELPVFHVTANRDMVEDNLGRVLGVIGKPYPYKAIISALEVIQDHVGRSHAAVASC